MKYAYVYRVLLQFGIVSTSGDNWLGRIQYTDNGMYVGVVLIHSYISLLIKDTI